MKKVWEGRRDGVLAQAIENGQIALAQAESESSWVGNNIETSADRTRKVHQAHLEFITHLVNDGVKHEGIDWLGDDNDYVDTLIKLAQLRGLKVNEQNIIDRFSWLGSVDINKETEQQGSDEQQVNDTGANKVNVRV